MGWVGGLLGVFGGLGFFRLGGFYIFSFGGLGPPYFGGFAFFLSGGFGSGRGSVGDRV